MTVYAIWLINLLILMNYLTFINLHINNLEISSRKLVWMLVYKDNLFSAYLKKPYY